MIKKSVVILLLFILFSIFAVPHEVKADGIGEVVLIGAAIVTVIGLVSILISPSTEVSQTSDGLEKNEIYAESNVINSGNKDYSIEDYPTKAELSEYPYALNIKFWKISKRLNEIKHNNLMERNAE